MNINYLTQPKTSVSHGLTIFVTVPRQKEPFLQQLDKLGFNIGLLLFREGEEAVAYESDAARIPMPYKTTEGTFCTQMQGSRNLTLSISLNDKVTYSEAEGLISL